MRLLSFMALFLGLASPSLAFAFTEQELLGKIRNLEQRAHLHTVASCAPDGLDCESSSDCCGGSTCQQGICSSGGITCRAQGATCWSSGECCASLTCSQGRCAGGPISCLPRGALCSSSIECCEAATCAQNHCE